MDKNTVIDKKWIVATSVTFLTLATGVVAAYYSDKAETKAENLSRYEQMQHEYSTALDALKKDTAARFATKEELTFLVQSMARVERGVDIANENIFKIQQNQIPLRVVAERVARIQKSVSATNAKVSDIKDDVADQKALVEKALPKKKGK